MDPEGPLQQALLVVLRRKLLDYRNYYGVIGNSRMLSAYWFEVTQLLYKWLNRRSQSLDDAGAVHAPSGGLEAAAAEGGGNRTKIPDCTGPQTLHDRFTTKQTKDRRCPACAFTEEPGAVIPHAGICEGGTGQPVSLPQENETDRSYLPPLPHDAGICG
jgi:hypothetical protein